jgi:hypothetical protein
MLPKSWYSRSGEFGVLRPWQAAGREERLGGRRSVCRRGVCRRRGAASLDYVLVLGVILPLAAFVLWAAPHLMNLVYQMTSVLVSWPFM